VARIEQGGNARKKVVKPPVWDKSANHGRIAANEYTGCVEVILPNHGFTVGSACPSCAEANTVAKLGPDTPKVFVRLVGSPLITGTRYIAPVTRCHLCQERFYTPVPETIEKALKYDVSVATTLAIARYSLGLPMYRIEQNQSMHGIPLKDSTQWDIIEGQLYAVVCPVFGAMIEQAANGELMVYDDTTGRIVENKAQGLATHTTAYISVVKGHKILLFFTGRNHAGKNADLILAQKTTDEPVTVMMDASPNNIPKHLSAFVLARFILCFCLVHGRRKFFEVFSFFDTECNFVLGIIGQVYANENHGVKKKLSPQERLLYHQKHSQPLMDSLYIWLNNQLLYEQIELNSGLGDAVRYMLKYWIPLTTFLRVAGAPLDSSWAERAIKIAIRHRRNYTRHQPEKTLLYQVRALA
jgi:transposase